MKLPIFNDDLLRDWLQQRQQPPFRAAQIRRWLRDSSADGIEEMTDLPKALREQLAADFDFWSTQITRRQSSRDGTEKLLLRLADGPHIECVLLRDGIRRTICVSSQVGCAMGCVFCASGLDGVERNLKDYEIVEQMARLRRLLPESERLSHIVMMGMGEPLANLKNVLPALEVASADDGFGISPRRITISTVGLPPGIRELAAQNSRFHLAISLHAPTDALRNQLVPVNHKIGIASILEAADDYFRQTSRRLTFEYVLLAEINDQPAQAHQLVDLLRDRHSLLNVIPYNPVAGLPYQTPSAGAIQRFRDILTRGGINVQFRERKGDQINAACGQLRRNVAIDQVLAIDDASRDAATPPS